MRKHIASIVALLALTLVFQISIVSADSYSHTFEYFEDGSYIETVIDTDDTISSHQSFRIAASQSTSKTKTKTVYFKNRSGATQWYVRVTGNFTYGSGKAICTKSSVTAVSNVSPWKITSKSASKNGATASASATATQYLDGTKIQQMTRKVTLTCTSTGKFY